MNEEKIYQVVGQLYMQLFSAQEQVKALRSQNEQLTTLLSNRNTSTIKEKRVESDATEQA